MSDEQEWDHWLDRIQDVGVNLTAWEASFVEDMQDLRRRHVGLTEKQAEVLEAIYAKRTP